MKIQALVCSTVLLIASSFSFADTVPDFAAMKDVKQKKAAFFDFIYEKTLLENKKILKERAVVKSASANSPELKKLCEKYSNTCENIDKTKRQSILKRVDIIPPSLVLAQAANESAWGTSRFAREANNYFGQWCFNKGCGLVPLRRNAGTSHEVRKFSNAQESVKGYLFNLNTGRAYASIRNMRAETRAANKNTSGMELAKGLSKYSERGQEYVKELRSMISYNKLVEKYDSKFWKAINK